MTVPAFTVTRSFSFLNFFFLLIKELAVNEMVEADAGQEVIRKWIRTEQARTAGEHLGTVNPQPPTARRKAAVGIRALCVK